MSHPDVDPAKRSRSYRVLIPTYSDQKITYTYSNMVVDLHPVKPVYFTGSDTY
jgi:hypothetical protein